MRHRQVQDAAWAAQQRAAVAHVRQRHAGPARGEQRSHCGGAVAQRWRHIRRLRNESVVHRRKGARQRSGERLPSPSGPVARVGCESRRYRSRQRAGRKHRRSRALVTVEHSGKLQRAAAGDARQRRQQREILLAAAQAATPRRAA